MTHLVFAVAAVRLALPVSLVREVVHAAEITPLPGAPPLVEGLVDVEGELHPVFDLRTRLGFARRAVSPDDHFVLTRANGSPVALHVEGVEGVVDLGKAAMDTVRQWSQDPAIAGVVRTADGLVLIHEIERFLSPNEWKELSQARPATAGQPE